MAIDIPLLDYDEDPLDPISRTIHARSNVVLPQTAVVTLLGNVSGRWAQQHDFEAVHEVEMITRHFPIWVGALAGTSLALAEIPLGGPAAVIVVEHLLALGVRTLVAVGSCGGLAHFKEGEFVLPTRALRDEGTSYHYLPAQRWVDTDPQVRAACAAAVEAANLRYVEAPTWTTDAFYRETRGKIQARRREGCAVVDMECASIAACATFRGARFGQILYTADTLADDDHDPRLWGRHFRETALSLALDAACRVEPRAAPDAP